jgi:hypothetical protein
MFFAIDIDETISRGAVKGDLAANILYYRNLGIAFPKTITDFPSLLQDPHVIPLHQPLPDAVEGVKHLSQSGRVGYYTVRKHDDSLQEARIQEATKQWLKQNQFPNPTSTVFCRSVLDKLVKLYEQEKESQESLMLIDDRWRKAIEAFGILDSHSQETAYMADVLRERLTIVAFGTDTVLHRGGLHVVALPSWSCVVDMYTALDHVG